MIIKTALSLAITAISVTAMAAAPRLASLDPVLVENRGALTSVSSPAAAPLPSATVAPDALPDTLPAATPAPGTGKASDAIWRKIMLGTWQAVDSPSATEINGEATFTPDGKAVGYTTATYVYADNSTSDVKIAMKFQWKIVNGVIILDQFDSDPAGFIKSTLIRRFEIKSMNDTGAVFKDLDDGQEVYRRRKPG